MEKSNLKYLVPWMLKSRLTSVLKERIMKSVIVFACLLTVVFALPQIRDRDCPCEDYDECTTIGKFLTMSTEFDKNFLK